MLRSAFMLAALGVLVGGAGCPRRTLAPTAPGGDHPGVLRIGPSPDLPDGFTVTVLTETAVDLQLAIEGRAEPLAGTLDENVVVEATRVDGAQMSAARFAHGMSLITGEDFRGAAMDPRTAQRYVVEPGRAAMRVQHDDGSDVTDVEHARVTDEARPLFDGAPGRVFLADRGFGPGAPVRLGQAALESILGGAPALIARRLTIALRSSGAGTAVFDVAARFVQGDLEITASGTLEVDTAQVLARSLKLTGTASGTLHDRPARGSIEITRTFTYDAVASR